MAIRLGQAIKGTSLLAQCNIPYSRTYENMTFYPLTTGTFSYYANGNTDLKTVNRQANHKYFIFLNAEITYSWAYFGIWDTYSTGYDGNRTAPTKDGNNYYALISPTTAAASGVPTLQFGGTTTGTANYACILDLTALGLDDLTAAEIYNKYKDKLELLATGNEITIDKKTAKISYKTLLNTIIHCRPQGAESYAGLLTSEDYVVITTNDENVLVQE